MGANIRKILKWAKENYELKNSASKKINQEALYYSKYVYFDNKKCDAQNKSYG
jgi:hypothetical protein